MSRPRRRQHGCWSPSWIPRVDFRSPGTQGGNRRRAPQRPLLLVKLGQRRPCAGLGRAERLGYLPTRSTAACPSALRRDAESTGLDTGISGRFAEGTPHRHQPHSIPDCRRSDRLHCGLHVGRRSRNRNRIVHAWLSRSAQCHLCEDYRRRSLPDLIVSSIGPEPPAIHYRLAVPIVETYCRGRHETYNRRAFLCRRHRWVWGDGNQNRDGDPTTDRTGTGLNHELGCLRTVRR